MQRAVAIFVAIILLLSVWACSSLYIARDHFASPLPVKLIVRNDGYGEGFFGAKRSGDRVHNGVDFAADVGTPVLAVKPGVVQCARFKKGNGNFVVLKHSWGYSSYYCHLSKINVREGQKVSEGQIIGLVGKTGNANKKGMSAHLHFELHKDGIIYDPVQVMSSGGTKYAGKSSADKSL